MSVASLLVLLEVDIYKSINLINVVLIFESSWFCSQDVCGVVWMKIWAWLCRNNLWSLCACFCFFLVGSVAASSSAGVLLSPVWSARSQQAPEAGPASAGDLPVQRPPRGKKPPLLSSPLLSSPLLSSPLLSSPLHSSPLLSSPLLSSPLLSSPLHSSPLLSSPLLSSQPLSPFVSFSGNQDLPEEEELGDVQLQTVLLSLWDASHTVWKSV